MSNFANQDVYLLILIGQGDKDIGLVNEETWNWIFSDFDSGESGYHEDVPESILKAYPNTKSAKKIYVTSGTYDNDRALQGPKLTFSSVKEAMAFIKKNNCNLVEEFEGCIY